MKIRHYLLVILAIFFCVVFSSCEKTQSENGFPTPQNSNIADVGNVENYDSEYTHAYNQGYDDGCESGYDSAYEDGYTDAIMTTIENMKIAEWSDETILKAVSEEDLDFYNLKH